MTNGTDDRKASNQNIVSFSKAVELRRDEEIGRLLAPIAECISGFGRAFIELHRNATLCGARFSDLQQKLIESGVHPDTVEVIRMYVRGAQEAFADEKAQGAFEAANEHFGEAASRLEHILREKK